MASEEDNKQNDAVSAELPAPPGWTKKLSPKKTSTPQKNDIVFISPTGEEIKSKRHLDQYLKSHPGGPAASEFDWSTGDTPRRSARLGEKSKAVVPPPSETLKKKPRKSGRKGAQEKTNAGDEEDKAADEKDANAEETKEETKEPVENSTENAKVAMDEEDNTEDEEKKTEREASLEEPSEVGKGDATTDNTNTSVEKPNDATNVVGDAKIDESKESKSDESKEASTDVPGAETDVPKDAAHAGEEAADGKVENNAEETQATENPSEKDSALQGATTGS